MVAPGADQTAMFQDSGMLEHQGFQIFSQSRQNRHELGTKTLEDKFSVIVRLLSLNKLKNDINMSHICTISCQIDPLWTSSEICA